MPDTSKETLPILLTLLSQGETVTVRPGGTSMLPWIHPQRDQVLLRQSETPPALHDVIFYLRADGSPVLHRIIRVEPDRYICTGDNQYWPEPVRTAQIRGKLAGLIRKGKPVNLHSRRYALYCRLRLPLRRFRKYLWTGLKSKFQPKTPPAE